MTSMSDARGAPMAAIAGATDVVDLGDPPSTAANRPGRGVVDRWWRVLWRPGAIYLASRALVLLTLGIVAAVGGGSLGDRIYRWDSVWYLRVSGLGYPSHLPMTHGHVAGNTLAFFPALPLAISRLAGLTGMSQFSAGVVISSLTGLTATLGVWALVREYAGDKAATRATILFAFFPGSFVFSLIYSEGIVITCTAFGLLALMRRRWVTAGLLGFVATAAAPIALAFALSAAWVAVPAVRRDRDWRALAAPVLAPLGTVAYLAWTWQHTGVASAFSMTERGGWNSYLSGVYPLHILGWFLTHPISSDATITLMFFCMIGVVLAAIIAVRDHQPSPVLVYGITVGALAMLTRPVGPRPRIILDAFPLILAVGVRYQDGWKHRVAIFGSAILLVAFTAYEVVSFSVFP
jgi:hypothetical protein